jgi:alpha-beta hydrolase superfamily lysophospholipase
LKRRQRFCGWRIAFRDPVKLRVNIHDHVGHHTSRCVGVFRPAELTEKRGFALKPCLLWRSRGGLWVTNWALENPNKVAGIVGIYPVFDLRSFPGLPKAAPAYQLPLGEFETRLAEFNPIARVGELAKRRVPICIIHGDTDKIAPLEDNSAAALERYRAAGAADLMKLIVPKGQGHDVWGGYFHCHELIDFAIARARAGARIGDEK